MKKIRQRLLSVAAAAALGCSAAVSSGAFGAASYAAEEGKTEDRLVPVMVKLAGEGLLAGAGGAQQGTDYLGTAGAVSEAASLSQVSSAAEAYIRSLYPALRIDYRYDVLMNGFSCELPENLISKVSECQWVESVTLTETVKVVKPELYYAPEAGGVDVFGETTGYYGEGEVIAVLDSEFDITHSMFAPIDDKENKLTRADIAAVAGSLNVPVDPDKAYVSSKLPFVLDYGDDTPYDVSFEEEYHGTHVAGIAAGDLISDINGDEIAGIARDAQLVMMKVFSDVAVDEDCGVTEYTVDEDILLAALEDAAKLKVDVINMSFGGPEPDLNSLPYKEALTALNNAGVMVIGAAGNSANNRIMPGSWLDMDANVPDTQTIGEPAAFGDVFCVAAADNSFCRERCFMIEGLNDEIPFLDTGTETVFERLGDGVHDYVYCGFGLESDFENADVEGKVALIDRGEITFAEKAANAANAGASCMIVCDNTDTGHLISMVLDGCDLPGAFISINDGEKLKNAESKKLRIDSTHSLVTPLDGGISYFSSFGPTEELRIKPEIAGIGGAVTSSAYRNGLKVMDGTSMAAPYVAGCAAVFDQYLRKNGTELTGSEKTAFIKNILMNSADLFVVDGSYESPRRQGAGLVDMKNVLNDMVILTGDSGLAKIELKDNLADTFSINVNIRNFSDKDVEFTDAKLLLTTDDAGQLSDDESGQISIVGNRPFGCTADLSSLLKTSAGESRTETITVQLSQSDIADRKGFFPNGFFVEGYIVLSGAENCCDISIPVMGFYGDWTQVPIFHEGTKYLEPYTFFVTEGDTTLQSGIGFAGYLEAVSELMKRLPEEETAAIMSDPNAIQEYMDEEFLRRLIEITEDDTYISPDGDGMADHAGMNFTVLRSAYVSGMKLYNSSGELVCEEEGMWIPAHDDVFTLSEADMSDLPDGEYTGVLEGYVFYEGAESKPQKYSFPIVIDNTAPELNVAEKDENGRKLIEITSRDAFIDGIYVMGRGKGGISGEYSGELMEIYDAVPGIASLYAGEVYCEENIVAESTLISALTGAGDAYTMGLLETYDFADIIPADRYMTEDGTVKITYDITEMEDYTVTAMDKAFNTTEKKADDGEETASFIWGAWWAHRGGDNDAYINIWDDADGNIRYQNGAREDSFTFVQTRNTITMNIEGEEGTETHTGSFTFTDRSHAVITWEDGTREEWSYLSSKGFAGFSFSKTSDIGAMVLEHYNLNNDTKAASAEVKFNDDELCTVTLLDEKGTKVAEYTGFDRFTGTAKDPAGNEVSFNYIQKGVYRCINSSNNDNSHYSVLFTGDGRAVVASAEEGILYEYVLTIGKGTITGNKGKEDEVTVSFSSDNDGLVTITFEDGREYMIALEPTIPEEDFKGFSTSELEELALDYAERMRADRPKIESAAFDEYGKYMIEFTDGQQILVDNIDGKGTDQAGNAVDLSALPEIRDLFEPGIWSRSYDNTTTFASISGNGYITFTDPKDGTGSLAEYKWTGVMAVDFTKDGETQRTVVAPISETELSFIHPDGTVEMYMRLSDDPDAETFYTSEELGEMALKNYWYKTGIETGVRGTETHPDGTVTIWLDTSVEYKVDHFTGKGTDAAGNETDLPQTGNNDITTASAETVAGVLMLFGAAAVLASGAFRRKKDN